MKTIYTIKNLQDYATSKGGECLSSVYSKTKDKYRWKCNKNHIFDMTWAQMCKSSSWCEICRIEQLSISTRKYSIQSLIDFAKTKNSTCLSTEYTGIFDKYEFICEFDHKFSIRWSDTKGGGWCQECSRTKYKIQDLQTYAKNKEGKCLSMEYVNYAHYYEWECKLGHVWKADWHSVKDGGTWCPTCGKTKSIESRIKYSLESLKDYAKFKGGDCLSTTYTSINAKYKWKCAKEHTWEATWKNASKKNYWCKRCANKQRGESSRKYSITNLDTEAKLKGGKCLSKEYVSANETYSWECKEGHTWNARWADVRKGHWCAECARKEVGSSLTKYKIDDLKTLAAKFDGECLETNESGYRQLKTWKCKNGHIWKSQIETVEQGSWCAKCNYNSKLYKAAEAAGLTILNPNFNDKTKYYQWKCDNDHIEKRALISVVSQNYCTICNKTNTNINKLEALKELAETKGGKCLSSVYTTNYELMDFECKKGHRWSTRAKDIKAGSWCPHCVQFGAEEQTVRDFVSLFVDNKKSRLLDIGIKSKKEIDIFVPTVNVGIEYCGLFWHSEKYFHKNKHYDKYKICDENNIRLLTIFSDEWKYRQDQVKNFIKSVLQVNSIKIPGRKCEIKEITAKEAKSFINEYHIQPIHKLNVGFGIFYNNELVGVMTGDKHHRGGEKAALVLSRLVFKTDVTVQGGASKLFKHLVQYGKEKNYEQIITWADLRWTNGAVYYKLGMGVAEILPPDYSYTEDFDTRISKQSCTKAKLRAKGAKGNTEGEMAKSLGLHRIYDCGKIRFEYDLKDTNANND